MKYHVAVDGREFEIEVRGTHVTVDGRPVDAAVQSMGSAHLHALQIGSSRSAIHATRGPDSVWTIHRHGVVRSVRAITARRRTIEQMTTAAKGKQGPRPVRATMPGLVVAVKAEIGDRVAAGQGVVIVEAMKMENQLSAQADGVVARVLVAAGDTVEKDQTLIEFEAESEGPS